MNENRIDKLCKLMLDKAHQYAEKNTGCTKVSVGSVIFSGLIEGTPRIAAYGANRTIPVSCKRAGCLRLQKYGNNAKLHRNPEDCRAIHSEVDAIAHIAQTSLSSAGLAIAVTRYPCEACARAIIAADISHVVYGRQQEISEQTAEMFREAGIMVWHIKDWDAPDVTY